MAKSSPAQQADPTRALPQDQTPRMPCQRQFRLQALGAQYRGAFSPLGNHRSLGFHS